MFQENERVSSELFQAKPKARAIELLSDLKDRLSLETHKNEIDKTMGLLLGKDTRQSAH
jgi:hypothetical protein